MNVSNTSPDSFLNRTLITQIYGHHLWVWAAWVLTMACLGVFNNILIVLAVCRFPALQNAQNMLLLNMSVMSLILDTVTVPLNIFNVIGRQYLTLPGDFCRYLSFLQQSTLFNLSLAICAVSINRCIAVVFPHFYRRISAKTNFIIFGVPCWLIPPMIALIGVTEAMGRYDSSPPFGYCASKSVPLTLIIQSAFLYVPTAVMAACYLCIVVRLITISRGRVDPNDAHGGSRVLCPTTFVSEETCPRVAENIFVFSGVSVHLLSDFSDPGGRPTECQEQTDSVFVAALDVEHVDLILQSDLLWMDKLSLS
ncbi:hypothetical protein BV898_03094 [Hypsibius exemplaris]|uniref:G-protein coupled receptors family 1 profile domain-containing protein n=1 Tax=Hypsibius exemplaris TaxID=2072580 RepID=A0A1W0X662_HYPEX|nr:hypothetical protein BV898_03094 [Hypsibius exemplaris]